MSQLELKAKLSSSEDKIRDQKRLEFLRLNDAAMFANNKGSQLNEDKCLSIIQNPDFTENLSVFLQSSSVWTNNTSTQDHF